MMKRRDIAGTRLGGLEAELMELLWAAGGTPTLRSIDSAQQPYIGYERPFGGMHPEGVNLLMVDGSVSFFMTRGNPHLLEEKATIEDH